jgi:type IV pilus biogenesis protein CpaD/CtpE
MVDAIIEKVMVLTPGQREVIETVLDRIIAGEHTIVEVNIPNDDTNRSGD